MSWPEAFALVAALVMLFGIFLVFMLADRWSARRDWRSAERETVRRRYWDRAP